MLALLLFGAMNLIYRPFARSRQPILEQRAAFEMISPMLAALATAKEMIARVGKSLPLAARRRGRPAASIGLALAATVRLAGARERAADSGRTDGAAAVRESRPYGSEWWNERTIRPLDLESTIRPRGRPKKQNNGC